MMQKRYFKIGELSSLFHIGVDSIRYYEKVGLLHPVRDEENNYRCYTLDDVRTMNTIRELLDLGFSTEEILAFEKDRNLEHATGMLEREEEILDRQIEELQAKRQNIRGRLHAIRGSLQLDCSGKVSLVKMPQRHVLMIEVSDMPDNMVNYELANYLRKLALERSAANVDDKTTAVSPSLSRFDVISTIGACDCYTLDTAALNADGSDYRTKNVFFYAPYLKLAWNHTLPAGLYLSACYRGEFSKSRILVPRMQNYARENGLTIIGDPMEFCHIDRYETTDKSEYLTEVQLQVRDA